MDDRVWSLASIEEAGPLIDTREIFFLAQALASGDRLHESLLGKPSDEKTESRRLRSGEDDNLFDFLVSSVSSRALRELSLDAASLFFLLDTYSDIEVNKS